MTNRKTWARDALISLLLAAGYMLIFAYNNTPLGAAIGSDNAMYLTMGTALAKGYAPYTEIFDHKGPLLFLLQLLPQAVSGGYSLTAVFIQETLVLFACLMMMRAIAKELDVCPWAAQLVYMAMTCAFMDGGNLTEEYANLPAICAIYLSIRCFGREEPEDKLFLPAMGMGVCAMAAFMLRANNARPIAALVLVLAVGLLTARRYVQLGQCAGGFVTGLLAVMIPIVLWLAAKDALREAWYGAIIHNMMYAESGTGDRFASLFTTNYGHMAIALAAFSCIGAGVIYRKKHRATLAAAMLAAAAAGGLAAFLSRKFYIHYLMLGAPLAAVGAVSLMTAFREKRRVAAGILAAFSCIWLGMQGVKANDLRLSERQGLDQFTQDAQTLMAEVPQEEREHFMAYRVEPKWYVAAKALPCMRFYFLQEILAQADPAVMEEIVAAFEIDPPHWLVLYYNRAFYPPYDTRMAEIFETKYEFVDAAGQYQLLRLRE